MKQKERTGQRIPPLDEIERVRESAYNGAALIFGHDRKDVAEEIAAEIRKEYIRQCQLNGAQAINNPSAWGFRAGRNEAIEWNKREQKHDSIEVASLNQSENYPGRDILDHRELLPAEKFPFRGRDEVLEALPELFELFQLRVIDQLDREDRLFFERYYNDKWSEEQIAAELNISPKAVGQRWRRLLVRMRRNLLQELSKWDRGNELFAEPFQDTKCLVGLLCLIRLFVEQGIDALRELVESFSRK